MGTSPGAPHHFRALGVSSAAEAAYVALLRGTDDLEPTIAAELEAAGLVGRFGGRWVPMSADGAVGEWANARAAEEAAIRAGIAELRPLYEAYLARSVRPSPVQVLHGRRRVMNAAIEMTERAQTRLDATFRAPFLTGPELAVPDVHADALRRGVRSRSIFESSLFADASVGRTAQALAALGEDVRAVPDVPLRMSIADGKRALVMLPVTMVGVDGTEETDMDALLVEASPILDALCRQFQERWDRATPLGKGPTPGAVSRERLIRLLALGLTDTAIARTLGLSPRTVHRRIAELTTELGVSSRFQLGMEIEKRGLGR